MAVREVEMIECDHDGCTMSSAKEEIPIQSPYFHVELRLSMVDKTGTAVLLTESVDLCSWDLNSWIYVQTGLVQAELARRNAQVVRLLQEAEAAEAATF